MAALVRTKSASFSIENSVTLEEFESYWEKGEYDKILIPPESFIGE